MYSFLLSILPLLLKVTGTKDVIFGHNNFTEYQVGNMNLILSVPHGGSLEPKDIPDREAACWDVKTSSCIFSHDCPPGSIQNAVKCKVSTNQDRYTIELAQALAEEINKITGGFFPHIIINHLQRFKMDANREKEEASFGIPQAEQAWEDYMGFLTTAKSQMSGGLILDIHGQAHPERWIELGYTLSKTSLNSGVFSALNSSISHLASQLVNVSSEILVAGNRSLGKYIEGQNKSYVCVPSPSNPSPNNGSYYSGGYITKTFGSRSSGTIDAIQLELPQWVRAAEERHRFCKALARAVMKFWQTNYCSQQKHFCHAERDCPVKMPFLNRVVIWNNLTTHSPGTLKCNIIGDAGRKRPFCKEMHQHRGNPQLIPTNPTQKLTHLCTKPSIEMTALR